MDCGTPYREGGSVGRGGRSVVVVGGSTVVNSETSKESLKNWI